MRSKVPKALEAARVKNGPLVSDSMNGFNGMFQIKRGRHLLTIISSNQLGWDHVSISLPNRTPSWSEMCFVKELFFDDDETVVQFHPKKSDYVNFHPFTLHLWKKQDLEYELPPQIFV